MTSQDLKNYLIEKNKIEFLLEELGCQKIKYQEDKEYWSATQPDGDNEAGVIIKNTPYLNYYSYSRGINVEDGKDIFAFIQDVKKCSFADTMKYIHNLLGLKYTFKKDNKKEEQIEKPDPLAIFKKAASRKRIRNVLDFDPLDENVLEDFVPIEHIEWFKDGIAPWAVKTFGLCYSYKHKRQVIPIRYWLDGSLMATNQRTTIENYKELGIRKYFLNEGYNKSINLYGLWENYQDIEKTKYCTLFEAERSVLKRYSVGDRTGVALQGHSISDEQVRIILGLDINEIVIALDKDICEEEIWNMCEKFFHIRHISYIYDKWDLLKAKDSPADARNKIYEFLFNHRIKYDESIHKKYLKSLEK